MGDTGGAGSGPGGGSGTGPGRIMALLGVPRFRPAATPASDTANDVPPSPLVPSDYTSQPYSIEDGTYGWVPESAAAEYVARQLRTRRAAA